MKANSRLSWATPWLLPLALVLGLLLGMLQPTWADGDDPSGGRDQRPPAEEISGEDPDPVGVGEERDGDPDEDEIRAPLLMEILRWLERMLG
jgi:hypothetical protein